MNVEESKKEIRKRMIALRDAGSDRPEKSRQIAEWIFQQPWFQSARTVCIYVSFRSEVDTTRILEEILHRGKHLVVPWCDRDELKLARIQSSQELEPRTIGLLEPAERIRNAPERECAPQEVDLYLVPGVAFSRTGFRIGYGKGLYDRLLAGASVPLKIGMAFHSQIVESFPVAHHDVRMDGIATEREFIDATGRT